MGEHLIDGQFQSDKYPTTPRGKVPLSCEDATAQDLLWQYAQRRRSVDEGFSADLEQALLNAGFKPPGARLYPEKITPALNDVLWLMLWDTGPIAHCFRAVGEGIPRKAEAEQAFVLHWLIGLALEHGDDWRKVAREKIHDMREAIAK